MVAMQRVRSKGNSENKKVIAETRSMNTRLSSKSRLRSKSRAGAATSPVRSAQKMDKRKRSSEADSDDNLKDGQKSNNVKSIGSEDESDASEQLENNNNEANLSVKEGLLKGKNNRLNSSVAKKLQSLDEDVMPLSISGDSPSKKKQKNIEFSPVTSSQTSPAKAGPASGHFSGGIPKTDSLSHLLLQGLQSSDLKMLDTVLMKSEDRLIANTLDKLPLDFIVPLLHELQRRLHHKGDTNIATMKWLERLLQNRLSFILTLPNLDKSLGALLEILNTRTDVFDRLLRLKGRLGLMTSQAKSESDNKFNDEPLLRYQEEESSSDDEDNESDYGMDIFENGMNLDDDEDQEMNSDVEKLKEVEGESDAESSSGEDETLNVDVDDAASSSGEDTPNDSD